MNYSIVIILKIFIKLLLPYFYNMKLYLVRHAKSLRNTKIKSEENTSLTKDGISQAKRIGSWFKKLKIDHIYCSKLKRAKDTLKKMKYQFKGIPITYTNEIREHDMGIYGKNGFDDFASYWKDAQKERKSFSEFKPKNGESLVELNKRAEKFYKKLLKKHSKENILIIGHGFFLSQLIIGILGLEVEESRLFMLPNASVSQFYINKKGKITHFHVGDFHHLLMEVIKEKNRPKLLLERK